MKGLLDASLSEQFSIAITFLFLLYVLSYYVLIFLGAKKERSPDSFDTLTIIIPAHNEQHYIAACLNSILAADFPGKKEILAVDDGSGDATARIISSYVSKGIVLIKTKHQGKAAAINLAISKSTGKAIAIVDADSVIAKNALNEILLELGKKNVGAACAVVKVQNRRHPFPMWSHIEQLYNSLMRSIFSKINANVTTPGPLSVYRRSALEKINGFSTEGFSEDVDVTIRLIRVGYRIKFAENAITYTNIPEDIKGFFRQRARFARGMLNILKRHMKLNRTAIDLYTLPLLFFSYVQAVIMGSITLYNIGSGYISYFASKGIYFNIAVVKFLFEWLSIIGFFKWAYAVLTGMSPLTILAALGITSTLLSYPLFLYAIIKFDKKIDLWHIIPLCFMFPFWLMVMGVYIFNIPELFKKEQYNIWKKNE